ncbi:hypothetical protein ACUODJ_29400, partial [Escherichia sp. HC-CC]
KDKDDRRDDASREETAHKVAWAALRSLRLPPCYLWLSGVGRTVEVHLRRRKLAGQPLGLGNRI